LYIIQPRMIGLYILASIVSKCRPSLFIIRAGIQILADHPRLYWNRHCTPGTEWFHSVATGLLQSPAISNRLGLLGTVLNRQVARSIHFISFLWFVFFILTHGIMVFVTGLRQNTNHMFAGVESAGWVGFPLFVSGMVLVGVAWWMAYVGDNSFGIFVLSFKRCSKRVFSLNREHSGLTFKPQADRVFSSHDSVLLR
jgi:hypothetical protein